VVDLQRGVAVKLLRHFRVPGQRQDAVGVGEIQLAFLVLAFGDVDGGVAYVQDGGAAAGKHAEPVDKLVRHQPSGLARFGDGGAWMMRFLKSTPRILIGENRCV
jgi:hypothetical protein